MFGEDQGRYVVAAPSEAALYKVLREADVPHMFLGNATSNEISFCRRPSVALEDLRRAHEGFFPKLMGPDAALA
jgi:phosphoribosylformylglycinamidine synthase